MKMWQRLMIGLARSKRITNLIQRLPLVRRQARQFVAGENARDAVEEAARLKQRKIVASLYYLGEYLEQTHLVETNVARISDVVMQLGESDVDVHVSIDLTQIGYSTSHEMGRANALQIGKIIGSTACSGRRLLMLGMEDVSFVDKTLQLRSFLVKNEIPTGISIQAYLHRSERDIAALVDEGAAVRLVKGAFAEDKTNALQGKRNICRNYYRLAEVLLSQEARTRGVYPIFGTHDTRLIRSIQDLAARRQWSPADFEFELLYGVKTRVQERLASGGYCVRAYLPFGREWWPYVARRIGERPENMRFVLGSLLNP